MVSWFLEWRINTHTIEEKTSQILLRIILRLGLTVKVVGHRSRSNMFLHACYLALGSRSKVKGRGRGQRSTSRSKVGSRSNFWRAAVDNRCSALPSAAKSNKSHYQFKVFVCVSVISGRMPIIVRMRSIDVLMFLSEWTLHWKHLTKMRGRIDHINQYCSEWLWLVMSNVWDGRSLT